MDLTRLRAFLRNHRRIALDTSVFICQLEANPRYVGLTDPVFTWMERPDHAAVTSTITMTELLVQPYRESGEQRAGEFYALLAVLEVGVRRSTRQRYRRVIPPASQMTWG